MESYWSNADYGRGIFHFKVVIIGLNRVGEKAPILIAIVFPMANDQKEARKRSVSLPLFMLNSVSLLRVTNLLQYNCRIESHLLVVHQMSL